MTGWYRCMAGVCLLILLSATPAATARPLLWHIEGSQNSVYLLGSIHALRQSDYPLPSVVQRAYTQADVLVLEVDPAKLRTASFGRLTRRLGSLPAGKTLGAMLPPALNRQLTDSLHRLNVNPKRFAALCPWLAALSLASLQLQTSDFNGNLGVDRVLGERAREDHKALVALETPAEQLQLFAHLSDQDQTDLLRNTLDGLPTYDADLRKLARAWRDGDVKNLSMLAEQERNQRPLLYRRILENRNSHWIPRIRRFLHSDKDYLVVVGALHLVGDQGLVAKLRAAGYRIRRL